MTAPDPTLAFFSDFLRSEATRLTAPMTGATVNDHGVAEGLRRAADLWDMRERPAIEEKRERDERERDELTWACAKGLKEHHWVPLNPRSGSGGRVCILCCVKESE